MSTDVENDVEHSAPAAESTQPDVGPVDVVKKSCECSFCKPGSTEPPMKLQLACPECGVLHIDTVDTSTGIDWATRPHKTHQCQNLECGYLKLHGAKFLWQPSLIHTVGVAS